MIGKAYSKLSFGTTKPDEVDPAHYSTLADSSEPLKAPEEQGNDSETRVWTKDGAIMIPKKK